MTRFIELSGHETGVRYVVNVGHIVSVRKLNNPRSDGSVVLLSTGASIEVRESCEDIYRHISALTEVQS